jgi:hypothetical protein
MAKAKGNSASSPKKSEKQEAFEREARETLENADMGKFDKMMKGLLRKSNPNQREGQSLIVLALLLGFDLVSRY